MNDAERYRALFPITQQYAFLDHATIAPLGRHVTLAVDAHLERLQQIPFHLLQPGLQQALQECKQRIATLIGAAQASEIAVVANGVATMNAFVAQLPCQTGDTILVLDGDDPATVLPWLNLTYRGVLVRRIPQRGGTVDPSTIASLIDKRTRVVVISSVIGATGKRVDLAAIGAICQKHGCMFVVDASHSLGVLPIDVQASQIDLLIAGSERWLLSGAGSAVLYCRQELAQTTGLSTNQQFIDSASYEAIVALRASLGLLLEIGITAISERVLDLNALLSHDLRKRGYTLRTSRDYAQHSGLLVVELPNAQNAKRQLAAANIIVSVWGNGLRFSPHFYNTEAEIFRVGEVLGQAHKA